MKTYIILGVLLIFFIYMVVWSVRLHSLTKRQKKAKRVSEQRSENTKMTEAEVDSTKDYWYNLREVGDDKEENDFVKYYHYFTDPEQGVKDLLLEMYDCGIVRTDELEEIAYGKNHLQNVDLSFLEELEREMGIDYSGALDTEFSGLEEGVLDNKASDIVTASKNLKQDDPGITDIHGTLSEGVENVIAAVEAEKKEQEEKEEPILIKKEKSVEDARKARKMTANAEIRSQIYDKWVGYVSELYEVVHINADEDTQQKIRKALMNYGHNDVDVLLESPE